MKGACVDTEGNVNDVRDPGRAQPLGLHAAGDEGRVEGREQRPRPLPEGRADTRGRARAESFRQHRLHVRSDVVGVPEVRSHRRSPPARQHRRHGQVRRVRLENVGSSSTHVRTDLVEPAEPVVAAVVGHGRPRDTKHPGASGSGSDVTAMSSIFIPRTGCDHRVVVSDLA